MKVASATEQQRATSPQPGQKMRATGRHGRGDVSELSEVMRAVGSGPKFHGLSLTLSST